MILDIYHGRLDPKQIMDDGWGFQGPKLKHVVDLKWTYGEIRVIFTSRQAMLNAKAQTGWPEGVCNTDLTMQFHEDMVVCDVNGTKSYYGDWDLQASDGDPRPFVPQ